MCKRTRHRYFRKKKEEKKSLSAKHHRESRVYPVITSETKTSTTGSRINNSSVRCEWGQCVTYVPSPKIPFPFCYNLCVHTYGSASSASSASKTTAFPTMSTCTFCLAESNPWKCLVCMQNPLSRQPCILFPAFFSVTCQIY